MSPDEEEANVNEEEVKDDDNYEFLGAASLMQSELSIK